MSDISSSAKRFPLALTGGESSSKPHTGPQKSKVDWLTATFQPDSDLALDMVVWDFLKTIFGAALTAVSCPGILGYENGVRFFFPVSGENVPVGRLDWGGNHHKGRARLDLSGTGCGAVQDWYALMVWLANECFDLKLTRVDLAVDLLNGEYTVEHARDWYLGGEFGTGGRMPRHSTVGAWLSTGSADLEPGQGRTLEIGRRQNGKMLRAYEKGRQLGDPDSLWTRFEVEFRNIDRDLPLDILVDTDRYFAGAYRCLSRILDHAGDRIATHQKEGEISLEKLMSHARAAYGKCIHVMHLTMSAQDVVESLSVNGVPARLERAAVFGILGKSRVPAWRNHHESNRQRV